MKSKNSDYSRLSREIQLMPDYIRESLEKKSLKDAFYSRPAYQQNDYLAWIARAKRADTRERRVVQMLDELSRGNVYMKMDWKTRK